MTYFIIGDIHACYFTTKNLLKHWHPNEKLVILGDIVHKGIHTFKTLAYMMNLQKDYPENVIILKGNNEFLFEQYYRRNFSSYAQINFKKNQLDYRKTLDWIHQLPHYVELENIFMSHAGVDQQNNNLQNLNELSLIFTKQKLRNIQKVQFLGHLDFEEPRFDEEANAWYLDTGAGFGRKLTGAKVNESGQVLEFISLELDERDKF